MKNNRHIRSTNKGVEQRKRGKHVDFKHPLGLSFYFNNFKHPFVLSFYFNNLLEKSCLKKFLSLYI